MKMLLKQKDVNCDKRGMLGRTPRLYAAHNRHKGVVKILRKQKEVNSDKKDLLGQTPLLYATWDRH